MPLYRAGSSSSGGGGVASHAHGNIKNNGAISVPFGGILSATNVDALSDGTFPLFQGSASGGVITVLNGVISVTSAGTGYVNTVNADTYAGTAGGSRFVLVTQSTQNAPANLPVITTTGGAITAGSFGTTAGSHCQGNDTRLNRWLTIVQENVDLGRTLISNPSGWSQQVTVPTNIAAQAAAAQAAGTPYVIDSIAWQFTNRLGTGQLFSSTSFTPAFRIGSQNQLGTLTSVNGVGSFNIDNYAASVAIGTRPWVGNTQRIQLNTSTGTYGKSRYGGGDLWINSATTSVNYTSFALTANMDATQTTLTQGSISAANAYEGTYFRIDNEVVLITSWGSGQGTTPTILRGQLGTTPAAHLTGTSVTANIGVENGGGVRANIYLTFFRIS